MSQHTQFLKLPIEAVTRLRALTQAPKSGLFHKTEDPLRAFLATEGTPLTPYQRSTSYLEVLLPYLESVEEIDLQHGELDGLADHLSAGRGATFVIMTKEHRDSYLKALHPEQFEAEELAEYFAEYTGRYDPHSGPAMLEAIAVLRDNLAQIDEESIVVMEMREK